MTYINAVSEVSKSCSIRKAAETLSITSTALNRRILAMEEELGVPIFERLARDTIVADCSAAARLIMDYGTLRVKIGAAQN